MSAGTKETLSSEPRPNLFPGFSASGQDVWLETAQFTGPGIVLSAIGARCGKCFLAHERWGVIANTAVFTPRPGYDQRYLWYVLNNEDLWIKGGTAQPFVNVSASLSQRWPFPDLARQQAIACFLDCKTAAIDDLIRKKEQLIELLEEKRQAVITHAVTRGLDPGAELTTSGIPWIGKVPRTWKVVRLRQAARLESGHTPSRKVAEYWLPEECNVPWISLADVWQIRDGRRDEI